MKALAVLIYRRLSVLVVIACWTTTGLADTSFDYYGQCRGQPSDKTYQDNVAVFKVVLAESGQQRLRGTATLISKDGFLITAAHVFKHAKFSDFLLVPGSNLVKNNYRLEVIAKGTPGISKSTVADDWALIRAVDWPKGGIIGIKPARLRYSIGEKNLEIEGSFRGFSDSAVNGHPYGSIPCSR